MTTMTIAAMADDADRSARLGPERRRRGRRAGAVAVGGRRLARRRANGDE